MVLCLVAFENSDFVRIYSRSGRDFSTSLKKISVVIFTIRLGKVGQFKSEIILSEITKSMYYVNIMND